MPGRRRKEEREGVKREENTRKVRKGKGGGGKTENIFLKDRNGEKNYKGE